jgi:serine/threonine protein kinase
MGATCPIEVVQSIGKFMLIEKLGEGCLGPVYRGFDQDAGNPVVVRILCDGIKWDARLEEIYDSACRAVAELQHPNIARIFETGKEGQNRYIVMESLGNGTLENLIAQNSAVPVEKKLSIMIQVAEGLGYAHKKGMVHQDLNPGKIHLTHDGDVKIRDFAIGHILTKYLPHPAVRWGAPIYLCPEQIQQKECDARSDLFSMGTIFYELINHLHPFYDRDSNKALDNILSDDQIPTFERFPNAPPGIWQILKSCLAKNPQDRYQSTDELSNACRELLESMAEDTRMMLAELYASLPSLRRVAMQPNAPEGSVALLQEIQRLSHGEREPDYVHLDRLMTLFVEQYPAIQAASSALPEIGSICTQTDQLETVPAEVHSVPPEIVPAKEPADHPITDMDSLLLGGLAEKPAAGKKGEVPSPEQFLEELSAEIAKPPEDQIAAPVIQEKASDAREQAKIEEPSPSERILPSPIPDIPKGMVPNAKSIEEFPALENTPVAPVRPGSVDFRPSKSAKRHRGNARNPYRSAALLLTFLVLAAAGYIALRTDAKDSIQKAWNAFLPGSANIWHSLVPQRLIHASDKSSGIESQDSQKKSEQNSANSIVKQARALAGEGRFEEGKGIILKFLETNPSNEQALTALKELETGAFGTNSAGTADRSLRESISRITGLINSGKLPLAKIELDRLQQAYPDAAEIPGLRKRLQAANSKQTQEQLRREEEQQKGALKQKEEEWNRQLSEFFARGKYNEASGALALWLSENPSSARAQELNGRIQEIQRYLKSYSAAMAESRYLDALNALNNAERLNPADPSIAELRRQTESRKAAAKAIITVHRLGPKATLLLDGHPIGKDGEIENESIPIGSHTLAIENGGGMIASRMQEYAEGQRVAFVYDLVKQTLRPMTDADRGLLAQRKAMEEVEQFTLEHDHGVFRGSCRGMLSINSLDVAYSPSSGSHGFRIPFKLLKLKPDGKSASLYYISDNSHFQTFKFQDVKTAEKFKQKWDELKSLLK